VWLGVGSALVQQMEDGNEGTLREMAQQWPFFQSTLDLIEMVLAKSDLRVSARYDELLVPDNLKPAGKRLLAARGGQRDRRHMFGRPGGTWPASVIGNRENETTQ
jgi:phosphoenolpyruvate carboxylase